VRPHPTAPVGDVRSRWVLPALIAASIATFIGVMYLTSYKNFFYDEWDFVSAYRPQQETSILIPHNEHWSTIPILIWKVLFVLFGLRAHWPYEAVALAAHLACAVLLFALIRRRSGDLPAFGAALILLVLGTGVTNIIWAFQIGWTLSIALGLLAMLVVDTSPVTLSRRRAAAISGALLGSLMSSGIGLGFLAAVTVQLLADRGRRHYLVAVVVPIVAYLAWFIAYGAGLTGTPGALCPNCPTAFGADIRSIGPGYVLNVAAYVSLGLRASAAGVLGLAGTVGPVGLILVGALLAWHWYVQERVESWELGLVAGLMAQFTLIGLTRVRFGLEGASDPHYVYVGVVYLLPLIANAIKRLPWRSFWRAALAGGLVLAFLGNAIQLVDQAIAQTDLMRTENAELRTLELFRGGPDMALNRPLDDAIMPQLTASRYFAAIDELGSPVPSSTPDSLSSLPMQAVDQEMVVLFGDALRITNASAQTTQGLACQKLDSSAGSILDFRVPDGGSIVMRASIAGEADFSLGFLEPPPSEPLQKVKLPAATLLLVHLPDTGRPVMWRLRITTAALGELQVCGADNLQAQSGGSVFSAEAAGGALDPGWAPVPDSQALGGLAAKLPAGTATASFKNDIFGTQTIPPPGTYDVWFRVRVASPAGDRPEMTLGLWDYTAWRWVGSTVYAANQVGSIYSWVRVATSVTPEPGHRMVFIAEFASHTAPLSTDWYVDEGVVVPNRAGPPT
jgi:hypothetical protein